ncbi:EipA family protein [Novosphingobium sp. ZN18A2]|uniref:DUF1134 domain-containing protein n=1 Tax=Novosphingobium sp. ZN18A2 TaxID=3079861 RepID=UPI0030CD7B5E
MSIFRKATVLIAGIAMGAAAPALAQVQTIDPNTAIDGDLQSPSQQPASQQPAAQPADAQLPATQTPPATAGADYATPVGSEAGTTPALPAQTADATAAPSVDAGAPASVASADAPAQQAAKAAEGDGGATWHEDDLIGAAEGVFGKGAKGLATMIEDILKKQGEPNGYIVGREAGGAFIFGLRYGSGTLYHKIEGQRPVYWTGPSIGFDAGAEAGSTFVLVYNLYDTEDLYKRFPAGEGQAYLVGGFNASYLRQGDVVLIPIRMGVGLRLGVNAGYMKFSHKQKWLPF